jgi:hypothetical protein
MLLSRDKPVTASSALTDHPARLITDDNIRTWWVASSRDPGEWVSVDLGEDRVVHAIQVNLADQGVADFAEPRNDYVRVSGADRAIDTTHRPTELLIEVSVDGDRWEVVRDARQGEADTPHLLVTLTDPQSARFVRVTASRLPYDAPFAVSGLRVFGTAAGDPPEAPVGVRAVRVDAVSATVSWEPAAGAHGYNVRYGLTPDKLYHCWQVDSGTSLDLTTLNAGISYWVAVDSFGESGVTFGEAVPVSDDDTA